MIPSGTLVVVHNQDLKASYIALLLEDFPPHRVMNPQVSILRMLNYPRQTAIMHGDVLSENLPAFDGQVCRMAYVCRWPLKEIPWADYESSVAAAREAYRQEAITSKRPDIQQLLEAHARGESLDKAAHIHR